MSDGEGQTSEVNAAEFVAAAPAEFDRSEVHDPMLQSLFAQLDRIEALQSQLARRFL